MKAFLKKYLGWLTTSNRMLHVAAGTFISFFCGLIPVIIAALSVEFKDWAWHGGKGWWITKNGFDWLDFLATLIGGILGALCIWRTGGNFFTGVF